MNITEAKNLKKGDYIHLGNSTKRWKVTFIKTWKTRPNDIRIGIKHGLYAYDSLSWNMLDEWNKL